MRRTGCDVFIKLGGLYCGSGRDGEWPNYTSILDIKLVVKGEDAVYPQVPHECEGCPSALTGDCRLNDASCHRRILKAWLD